jgi:tricorn protease
MSPVPMRIAISPVARVLVAAVLLAAPSILNATAAAVAPPLPLGRADVGTDRIVFSSSGDLFTVPLAGGPATPLTEGPGWDDVPVLSPDGAQVVFSRRFDGNSDLYVVPLDGSTEPRRLTWHPKVELARDWSPDGRILFTTDREGDGLWRLYTIRLDDPWEMPLDLPRGAQASWSPDGRRLALTPFQPRSDWQRYRGGAAPRLSLVDLETAALEPIPAGAPPAGARWPAGDWEPLWVGGTVYFLSERDGTANLYAYDTSRKSTRAVTRFDDFGVQFAAAGPGGLVLVRHGRLWRVDAASGNAAALDVTLPERPAPHLEPREAPLGDFVASLNAGPMGRFVVVEARGDLYFMDPASGASTPLTQTPHAADRSPVPSPDGRLLAWLSDETGHYALHLATLRADAGGPAALVDARRIDIPADGGFLYEATWSPDGTQLALSDNHQRLWRVEVAGGRVEQIDTSDFPGGSDFQPAFSADGRYLAWTRHTDDRIRAAFVRATAGGPVRRLSPAGLHCERPTFAADDSELFLTASTLAPAAETFGMSGFLYRGLVTRFVIGVPLDGAPAPTPGAAPPTLVYRVLRTEPRNWRAISRTAGGGLLGVAEVRSGPGLGARTEFAAYRLDSATGAETKLVEGARAFGPTPDGATLLVETRNGWSLQPADSAGGAVALSFDALRGRVDRRAEWAQLFRDAVTFMDAFFHDPAHHGQDLDALRAEYETFLPGLRHREDLTRLIERLYSHVSVSHLGVDDGDGTMLLGDDGSPVRGKPVALLGIDVERVGRKVRIARIIPGDNFSPLTTSPLAQPGATASPGEYLLAVNGVPVDAGRNFYSYLEMERPGPMELTVGADSTGAGARTLRVRPLPGENTLRRMAWAEHNRAEVARLSGGRLGYIYLPDTGFRGFESFHRDLFAQRSRAGLVIDERFNSGGAPTDLFVEILGRRPLSAYSFRDGEPLPFPTGIFEGSLVLIVNEMAGSGGDTLPWMFRKAGLGPLVGRRTMGAGIGGYVGIPSLADGGGLSIPNRAFFNPEGSWDIENGGVPPDIDVEITPADFRAGRDPQLERAVEEALKRIASERRPVRKLPTTIP